ncbi:MAG: Cof-type HAD-IIB family hydrolase [Planctomycetes bacterium]|nr:Cof-type HAD-IIB family hydrolase [Planctomycetota bacterium]
MTPRTMTPSRDAAPTTYDGPAIELIALDVDGTLLRSDKRLSKRVVKAVRDASAKGVRVVLASARPPRSMREIYDLLALKTYQVNYNGALIHDPITRRHIHHQPLSGALAGKVIKLARKVDPDVVVSIEILDKWYTDHVDDTLPTETSKAFMPDYIGPLEAFLHVPVTKLMLLGPPDRIAAVRAAVLKKFQGEVAIAVSDSHLLQVVHPKVDKSHALAMIAKHYGIATQAVMAIGDAPNDVGMLKWAGLGVAVGNAWHETRAAADIVVPANDEDGVSHAIKAYVLDK